MDADLQHILLHFIKTYCSHVIEPVDLVEVSEDGIVINCQTHRQNSLRAIFANIGLSVVCHEQFSPLVTQFTFRAV